MKILFAVIIANLAVCGSGFVTPSNRLVERTVSLGTTTSEPSPLHSHRLGNPSIHGKSLLHTSLAATAGSSDSYDDSCDVLVIGSGPAGCAIASLLGAGGVLDVVVADKNFDKDWIPNYGVWKDEWETIMERYLTFGVEFEGGNYGNSVDREWSQTDCFFGGSFGIPMEERLRLDRPYNRVDRFALKDSLSKNFRVVKANHMSEAVGVNMYKPAGSILHDEDGTTIQLQKDDDPSPMSMRAKIVIDTTGHETKLTLKDTKEFYTSPGFQIAYGATLEVDESSVPDKSQVGPYDKESMTLFDYRTDHFYDDVDQIKAEKAPTFMYAMPLKDNEVFFEETSLVARPAMSFQECKDRFFERLDHLGIKVDKVTEEEFCYIPMGGALPIRDQRIFGFGGAAAMVHPSTGYSLCRVLMGASDAAKAIKQELASDNPNVDRAVASAYHSIWSPDNIRQRSFATYGGEFLMKQNVVGLRGFFDGFFRLPLGQWGGFLAGWPGLAHNENHETWLSRIAFGVNFLIKLPPQVAVDMTASILQYSLSTTQLLQSVTPFFGEPASYEYDRNMDRIGDVAVKNEARQMMADSEVVPEVSIIFDEEAASKDVPSTNEAADKVAVSSTAESSESSN